MSYKAIYKKATNIIGGADKDFCLA